MILVIGGILAVVGPLITILGGLASAIVTVAGACTILAANPVVLTVMAWTAAIAGLVAGVWAVIKAIQTLIDYIKHVNRMKIQTIKTDFDETELKKLSNLQASMGDSTFAAKFGKDVSKQVSSYRQNNIQTSNKNNTTNYNFYGNIGSSSGSSSLDKILNGGQNVPSFAS